VTIGFVIVVEYSVGWRS